MSQHVRSLIQLAAVVLVISHWTTASAQAWVGYKGGLGVDLDYNLGISDTIVGDSEEFTPAGTQGHTLTLSAEYVPIEKLAVNVQLPIAFLKYTGSDAFAHPGGGSYDDGKIHTTLTDLRLGTRYMVLQEPVAISPHLGFSIPVADYETIGNTVAGRGLMAAHLGLSIGKFFADKVYVHLLYEFSLVQKYDEAPETEVYGQNRSDLAATVGVKLLEEGKLDLHASLNMRRTHGGLSLEYAFGNDASMNEELFHDAILREEILVAGGGVGYQITDSFSASFSAALFVAGKNTQKANVFGVGLAWSPL
jgi:hypothetical protein